MKNEQLLPYWLYRLFFNLLLFVLSLISISALSFLSSLTDNVLFYYNKQLIDFVWLERNEEYITLGGRQSDKGKKLWNWNVFALNIITQYREGKNSLFHLDFDFLRSFLLIKNTKEIQQQSRLLTFLILLVWHFNTISAELLNFNPP